MSGKLKKKEKGLIFDIQRYSINDGPGIRTTIFFQGCPLSCLWCDNPESQFQSPQLFFFQSLCNKCYHCLKVCPTGATTIGPEGAIRIDRRSCKACGTCMGTCLSEARAITGRLMEVDEVLEIVEKDALFYRNSGGGVTASGGEATAQPGFLLELFKKCQERGHHTTLDTCGYVEWGVLKEILEYTDLVLFDVKHMDPASHNELTGLDNRLILENAEKILQQGKLVRVRIPLIPGCNDSEENIKTTAAFIVDLGLTEVDLLPYHRLGAGKYERLGKGYKLMEIHSYREEEVQKIKGQIESLGISVTIA